MSDTPNKAREMLAAEYEANNQALVADDIRTGRIISRAEQVALRAIEKALTPPMSDTDVERVARAIRKVAMELTGQYYLPFASAYASAALVALAQGDG